MVHAFYILPLAGLVQKLMYIGKQFPCVSFLFVAQIFVKKEVVYPPMKRSKYGTHALHDTTRKWKLLGFMHFVLTRR